jgi:hypothetical protein
MTRLLVACLTAMLVACASVQQGSTPGDVAVRPDCGNQLVNPLLITDHMGGNSDVAAVIVVAGILIFTTADVIVYSSCEIDAMRHPVPADMVVGGIYRARSGSFSISLPRATDDKHGMDIYQIVDEGGELVTFQSKGWGDRPTYVVSVSPSQQRSVLGNGNLKNEGIRKINSQDVTLDGQPAVFEVFVHDPNTQPEDEYVAAQRKTYYLVYTLTDRGQIALLSVSWPGQCQGCDGGDEQQIRKLNPALDRFVGSFHMPAQTSTP